MRALNPKPGCDAMCGETVRLAVNWRQAMSGGGRDQCCAGDGEGDGDGGRGGGDLPVESRDKLTRFSFDSPMGRKKTHSYYVAIFCPF